MPACVDTLFVVGLVVGCVVGNVIVMILFPARWRP